MCKLGDDTISRAAKQITYSTSTHVLAQICLCEATLYSLDEDQLMLTFGTTILPCGLMSLLVSTFSNNTVAPMSSQDLAPGRHASVLAAGRPELPGKVSAGVLHTANLIQKTLTASAMQDALLACTWQAATGLRRPLPTCMCPQLPLHRCCVSVQVTVGFEIE